MKVVRGRLSLAYHFFICFLIVVMLVDIRNRTSNTPTKVSPRSRAYVYRMMTLDGYEIKVVLADSPIEAQSYLDSWKWTQGLENCFFTLVGSDDFDIAGQAGDSYYHNLLFDNVP